MIGLSTKHKDLLLSLHARSAEMLAFCFVFLGNYIFISDQNVITEGIRNRICIFFSSHWESRRCIFSVATNLENMENLEKSWNLKNCQDLRETQGS